MQNLLAPYKQAVEQFRGRPFLIIGAAPMINDLDYYNVVYEDTVVVALNNAFLKWESDILFFADKRFIRPMRRQIKEKQFCVFPDCLQKFFRHPAQYSHIYHPTNENSNDIYRLKAGFSVLIPALHFAFLMASSIQITGWEMKDHSHWDRIRDYRQFPQAAEVRNQVLELQLAFDKEIEFIKPEHKE